ncbi:hypothetical protein CcaverHIS002_0704420 [Cutaneotrichosporon cavernicola]|uniref:Peroxin-3 n=1 Tax=Cutaneotrichosporon cavernicola TaxID=279322 RepID=A0AA48LAE3_9TREE|nr:uncharacterized protein CcaverHIS019_0704500 [Cutaneotrichosporon cavernicola]BEI87096.1 hypothetical protein CcaverHIS002_0704420 [Cutaneotrichosporon cavernicola]BEI94869.1 hypothetical protein CcaverHIS019_0704500 [Cutaneotrichosporon cavernicola]BEJ02642.1 hypothetical protein CcaverHIS631_0704370 [Cutaneotrichosporon cavernicola]
MPSNPWHRRVRRMLFVSGAVGTLYFLFGYVGARMRDARLRAMRERRERETLKAHFTSLLSTISFTLYALLPNLEPALFAAYPVESTSQALQAKSAPPEVTFDSNLRQMTQDDSDGGVGALGSPADTGTTEPTPASTPADSLLLGHDGYSTDGGVAELSARRAPEPGTLAESLASVASESTDATEVTLPAESWASEFTRSSDDELLTSSTISQAISLPPTDTSSVVPSPQSQMSPLEASPPHRIHEPEASPPQDPRTKKQLWRDLKVQSLTRAFATAYLVPLIYLLTSSQLTILSRGRYLEDVQAAHRAREREAAERAALKAMYTPKSLWSYLSPDNYVPEALRSYLPWSVPADPLDEDLALSLEAERNAGNADAERLFLTYSWWLLNEGWRTVSERVEGAVDRVFGGLGLKRELTAETWPALVKEVRAQVETDSAEQTNAQGHHAHGKHALFDFTAVLLPPTPLPALYDCPLPTTPGDIPHGAAHLANLLSQTREHVSSPDARALLDTGVSAMLTSLTDALRNPDGSGRRRLADILPELNRWSRGVWEGIPDGGVEALLALPEFEAFAAVIFGDWAPRPSPVPSE